MSVKKRASSKPFFTMLAALSFLAIVGLAFFRFNASQLENRLGSIERSIERYSAEEVELKQILSGLTSPIKIYSYCKDQLGMSAGKQELVRVPSAGNMAELPPVEPQKGWRSSIFSFFGFAVN
jgi:cell division protein FtsL